MNITVLGYIFVACVVGSGTLIAVLVRGAAHPFVASVTLSMLGASVPTYLWATSSDSADGFVFNQFWPYVFVICFAPTALIAAVVTERIQRRKGRASNPREDEAIP